MGQFEDKVADRHRPGAVSARPTPKRWHARVPRWWSPISTPRAASGWPSRSSPTGNGDQRAGRRVRPESAKAMADRTLAEFGGIDYLVNNAAIFGGMKLDLLLTVDWDYYKKFMSVNLDGALVCTRGVPQDGQARRRRDRTSRRPPRGCMRTSTAWPRSASTA